MVHKPSASGPVVIRLGIRDHWDIFKITKMLRPLLYTLGQIEVLRASPPPIKANLPVSAFFNPGLHHAINGRKTRTAAQKYNGALGLPAYIKGPKRQFNTQTLALFDGRMTGPK